jgi:hypothetical protein
MTTINPDHIQVGIQEVNTLNRFKKFVEGMMPGLKYEMPDTFKYKWLEIDFEPEHIGGKNDKSRPFSWSAERNYSVLGSVGYVFPTKGNYVKYWAKEETAKENLIEEMSWIYNKK